MIVALTAAALVSVILGTAGAVRSIDQSLGRRDNREVQAMPPPAVSGATAPGVVRAYLEAVAAGDWNRALSFAEVFPGTAGQQTGAVLKAALRDAPITDIDVPEVVDPGAVDVTAHFRIGGQRFVEAFPVARVGDEWKLRKVVVTVPLDDWSIPDSAIWVNGVEVATMDFALLPGLYRFTSGNWAYRLVGQPTLVVSNPQTGSTLRPAWALTKSATTTYEKVVRRELKRCVNGLRSVQPTPTWVCPFGWRNEGKDKVDVRSVRWRVVNDVLFQEVSINGDGSELTGKASVYLRTDITCPGPCYPGRSNRAVKWFRRWDLEPTVSIDNEPTLTFLDATPKGRGLSTF